MAKLFFPKLQIMSFYKDKSRDGIKSLVGTDGRTEAGGGAFIWDPDSLENQLRSVDIQLEPKLSTIQSLLF